MIRVAADLLVHSTLIDSTKDMFVFWEDGKLNKLTRFHTHFKECESTSFYIVDLEGTYINSDLVRCRGCGWFLRTVLS